jgi:hypothetical protein
MTLLAPVSRLQHLRYLALGVFLLHIFALIVHLLAFSKAYLDLDQSVLEIESERNGRVTLFTNPAINPVNFLAVEQQLAITVRLMILAIAEFIVRNSEVMQIGLPVTHQHEGFIQTGLAGAQRLDLCTLKDHAGLQFLFYEVIVVGLLVIADQFFTHDR